MIVARFFDRPGVTSDGWDVGIEERSDLPGKILDGRYKIVRRIGLGGTGVAYVIYLF